MGNFTNRLKKEADILERNKELKGQQINDLLISMKMESGHIHCVMPSNDKVKDELIEDLRSDIPTIPTQTNQPPKEVIFKNRQAWGDICVMTSAIRDFKTAFPNTKVGVITTARHLFDNNPHIDHQFVEGNITEIGPGFLTNASNRTDLHFVNAFRISMEQKLNITIPQGPIKTDLWMTQEEINRKPLIDGPYWILAPNGAPGWPLKMYDKWPEVIKLLEDDIQFVQIGIKDQYPLIPGAIDFRGKTEHRDTGIRDVINLFYHCEGSLGLVSAHCHINSSFGYPCVVVAGAREPEHFTHYQGHQYISTDGTLPCAQKACWSCKLEACKNLVNEKIPKCVHMIPADLVAGAVRRYYDGGVLTYNKKRPRPKFENVVKEKQVFVVPKAEAVDEELLNKYGFKWGGGSVTDRDWMFMKKLVEDRKIENVLEFGTGLSSLLLMNSCKYVETYETSPGWIEKIKLMANENLTHYHWDGILCAPLKTHYDLAFVDGPAGGENREHSTRIASEHADLIIIHDAGRKPEREWQEKYLAKDFDLIAKGGHRIHLWEKRKSIVIDKSKPLVKMVTTCRGFGGSERSTLYLMQGLLERNFNVELIPTGNVCGPYLNSIPKGVIKREWNDLSNPCDLLIFYCSDCIWNFKQDQYNIMNELKAKRKVMILNYQLGDAGKVPWTLDWDKYIFLNSTKQNEFLERCPDSNTTIIPPPVDPTEFLKVEVDYSFPLRFVRHNSQRDAKWPIYTNDFLKQIIKIKPDSQMFFMPARSDCFEHQSIHKYKVNEILVPELLSKGNIFINHNPPGYQDQGPRTIIEAMLCGLPVLADNSFGAKDRITSDTGWLCDNMNDYLKIIETLTEDEIRKKGIAARNWAKKEFNPQRWVEEIIKDA